MIRVALVGIGGMGRCHFNCYKNVENAELVAVCDVRTERAREIAGPDMPIYADLDEMLAALITADQAERLKKVDAK